MKPKNHKNAELLTAARIVAKDSNTSMAAAFRKAKSKKATE